MCLRRMGIPQALVYVGGGILPSSKQIELDVLTTPCSLVQKQHAASFSPLAGLTAEEARNHARTTE